MLVSYAININTHTHRIFSAALCSIITILENFNNQKTAIFIMFYFRVTHKKVLSGLQINTFKPNYYNYIFGLCVYKIMSLTLSHKYNDFLNNTLKIKRRIGF